MTRFRQTLGLAAEDLAADYLQSQGYTIVERRHRNQLGEIDLIARREERLFFIEVKAKTGLGRGSPEEMVDRHKQAKLKRVIGWYLMERGETPACQVDVIAVDYTQGQPRIRHIEHAFEISEA